jgi:hypothetical protein
LCHFPAELSSVALLIADAFFRSQFKYNLHQVVFPGFPTITPAILSCLFSQIVNHRMSCGPVGEVKAKREKEKWYESFFT